MVHCSNIGKAEFGDCPQPVANDDPKPAKIARHGKAILIGHIIADEDGYGPGKGRFIHKCRNRSALVRAGRNKFDHAFAALHFQMMLSRQLLGKSETLRLKRRVRPVVQGSAMGLVLKIKTRILCKCLDRRQRRCCQPAGRSAQRFARSLAAIAAMRSGAGQRQRAKVLFQINNRPATDQRQTAIKRIGQCAEALRQPIRHCNAIGRWRQFHQRAIEIEEQGHVPRVRKFGKRGWRRQMVFRGHLRGLKDCLASVNG